MLRTSPVVVGAANTEFVLGNERLTSTGQKSELAAGEAQQTQASGGSTSTKLWFCFWSETWVWAETAVFSKPLLFTSLWDAHAIKNEGQIFTASKQENYWIEFKKIKIKKKRLAGSFSGVSWEIQHSSFISVMQQNQGKPLKFWFIPGERFWLTGKWAAFSSGSWYSSLWEKQTYRDLLKGKCSMDEELSRLGIVLSNLR